MDDNKKNRWISTIFFSVFILSLLVLSGSKVLILGEIQSNKNPNDNTNMNSNYNATLSGNQQVPSVKTNGIGTASFELLDDNKTLHYQITALDVPNITGIHIHQGKTGENGDVIVNLYHSNGNIFQNVNETKLSQIDSSSVTINGKTQSSLIASGTINNSDLKGPLLGKNISDLITLMQSKNTYVNVHSESHPDGEIRGQIS
ncbi:MAG TPA: CHRD domain-containing protein [Nitrososphaeraceae archaeon]|nr:CHRD domain-containing protein [Nitrososphaeraceae archaeon]